MNLDEFAFFNQQLAAMLRAGIPLEGALRQLSAGMRRGRLREELQQLEADLAKGTPLREALSARQLPELYVNMLEVGAQSNNLPAVLTLLADHYQRRHALWTRLKGLMVYPMIVLVGVFLLSCLLSVVLNSYIWPNLLMLTEGREAPTVLLGLWLSPFLLGLAVLAVVIGATVPPLRRVLRWRLPAFRESSLARVASAMGLMLSSGVPLDKALALAEQLEAGTCAGTELDQWRQRLASGHGKFAEMAPAGRAFPPLFLWLAAHGGDDLAAGFQRAAELYQARASYRAELLLYSALPCSVLLLGLIIISQIQPVVSPLVAFLKAIGTPWE